MSPHYWRGTESTTASETTTTWSAGGWRDPVSAERWRTARTSIRAEWPDLTLDVAYAAQDIALADRRARGETVVSIELGLHLTRQAAADGRRRTVGGLADDAMALRPGCRFRVIG